MHTSLTAKPGPSEIANRLFSRSRGLRQHKRSWASEIIAAAYIALLVSTPWLVRDARWFTPPSNGVELQFVTKAPMTPPADATAPAAAGLTR